MKIFAKRCFSLIIKRRYEDLFSSNLIIVRDFMKTRIIALSTAIVASLLIAFTLVAPAHAGSCSEPVTSVKWTGSVNSTVNMRDMTCMDGAIVGSVSAGLTVDIIGEADGWYLILMKDGRKGFVWNSFITITGRQSTGTAPSPVKTEVEQQTRTEIKDTELSRSLRGHILLQVENHGEAWYVHPEDGRRFYMKDGDTAYQMMREFGLGASNADIDRLLAGDKSLAEQVKGKIVLAVERHGEAYYVNPSDLSVHYLKDGKEAYRIMRELSLGITNNDLQQISFESFDAYLAEKRGEKAPEVKNEIPTEEELEIFGSIGLTAQLIDNTVHLSWSVNQTNVSRGFKILYDTKVNPTFPEDTSVFVEDTKTRKLALKIASSGEEFHFRVCQYTGKQCGVYSNNVKLFVSENDGGAVKPGGSIKLVGSIENDVVKLSWQKTDLDSSLGYKLVYDINAFASYPEDTSIYIADPNAFEFRKVDMPAGKYYFRICRYTGEGCDIYSNEIVLNVQGLVTSSIQLSPYQEGIVPAGVDLVELNRYWAGKINDLRAESDLRKLTLEQRWLNTASEWAGYMGSINSATHTRPDGKSMHQWIETKGLKWTVRYSENGWNDNYFTENIAWGIADGTTESVKKVLDDTLAFFLSEAATNGDHYRTIYHEDWNSLGLGFYFKPDSSGKYKVFVAMHYGSIVLDPLVQQSS